MGCCGKRNSKESRAVGIVKFEDEGQIKKKTPWLIWAVLLMVFMLLIFSVLH